MVRQIVPPKRRNYHLDVPAGNILIGESKKTDRRCEACQMKMIVVGSDYLCKECGLKVALEDKKPKSKLVAKDDGKDFIAQPEDKDDLDSDLPPGAVVTWEEELVP